MPDAAVTSHVRVLKRVTSFISCVTRDGTPVIMARGYQGMPERPTGTIEHIEEYISPVTVDLGRLVTSARFLARIHLDSDGKTIYADTRDVVVLSKEIDVERTTDRRDQIPLRT